MRPANATKLGIYGPRRRRKSRQPKNLYDHKERARSVLPAQSAASPLHKKVFCILNRNDPLSDYYFFNDSGELICSKCLALDEANPVRAAYIDLESISSFGFFVEHITRLIRDFPHNAPEFVQCLMDRANRDGDCKEPDAEFLAQPMALNEKFRYFLYAKEHYLIHFSAHWRREMYREAARVLNDYNKDSRDNIFVVNDQFEPLGGR